MSQEQLTESKDVMRFAFSGDPDDAFSFFGLATNRVAVPWSRSEMISSRIQELNNIAIREARYDVSAISSAAYPRMQDRYVVSSVGSSVGRNYGPMLAAKRPMPIEKLRGRKIASPGEWTTGHLLLRWALPESEIVVMPFDEILGAVVQGEVCGGVLIHEELLNYQSAGLYKVRCLGEFWNEMTAGLPLPVGINVIRRDLSGFLQTEIVRALRESLMEAMEHPEDATAYADQFSIAHTPAIRTDFINRFANDDTLNMDTETRRALRILLDVACKQQELPRLRSIDIV